MIPLSAKEISLDSPFKTKIRIGSYISEITIFGKGNYTREVSPTHKVAAFNEL